ncbi:MAG: hypothetical protein ACKO5K_11085 [Armatimonadota bacterium]
MDDQKKTTLAIVLVVAAVAICIGVFVAFGRGSGSVSATETESTGKEKMQAAMQQMYQNQGNRAPGGMAGQPGAPATR